MKKLEENLNIDSAPVPAPAPAREGAHPHAREGAHPHAREITVTNETDDRRKELDKRADYAEVRSNLKEIIGTGMSAIDGILQVASEGESPRAYEVVSQLIKSVTEANKDLIGLHQQMKDINKDSGDSSQKASSITNNSIFVGSTKDLQRLVKDNFKQLRDQSNVSE